MTYTIEHALNIARQLEPTMARYGIHVAIGGSLVYRGTSDKDIDIFLYPHDRNVDMNPNNIVKRLAEFGYVVRDQDNDSTFVPDVFVAYGPTGFKVDFFFMSRVERHFDCTLSLVPPCAESLTLGPEARPLLS